MTREWFVNASRQAVNLGTLRGGDGKATTTVYRIVEQPGGALLRSRWVRSGEDLPTFRVNQAQAAVSADPIPADPVPGTTLGAADPTGLTTGEATLSRLQITSSTLALGASGRVALTYFTATRSRDCTQLRTLTGGTAAAATPTLNKMGLYSVAADGALTRVAATAHDATLFAAANTAYTRAAGSFSVAAGQRYAFAILVVTAVALPTFAGFAASGSAAPAELALAPRLAGILNTQTDLPASIPAASVGASGSAFYGVAL